MKFGEKIGRWIQRRSAALKGAALEGAAPQAEPESLQRSLSLSGKRALVFGVATEQSIAWRVARTLNDNGCQVALGFQKRMGPQVRSMAKALQDPLLRECELTKDEEITDFFQEIEQQWSNFDYLVHSVAFAKKAHLEGRFYEVDRRGYGVAQEVSVYSLAALVKAGAHLFNPGGSVVTFSYLGAQRAVPHYNIMGVCKAALEASVRYLAADLGERQIRVNAVSAGPVRTLASSGIAGFETIFDVVRKRAPLKRNIQAQDVADLTLFLCSDLARNITGQVIYVDSGYSVTAL